MKYPQTTAQVIAENCEAIGKWGCLAMCYAYCVGIQPDDEAEYIRLVSSAMDARIIDEECTVFNASAYLEWLTGRTFSVTKKDISTIENIKEATPVRYVYNGKGHWVVVENGRIVFNSIMNSVCVTKGKPSSARIMKLVGVSR